MRDKLQKSVSNSDEKVTPTDPSEGHTEEEDYSSIRTFKTMPIGTLRPIDTLPVYDLSKSEHAIRRTSARALRRKMSQLHQMAKGEEAHTEALKLLTVKQERFNYFNDSLKMMRDLVRISFSLREVPEAKRLAHLAEELENFNAFLLKRESLSHNRRYRGLLC